MTATIVLFPYARRLGSIRKAGERLAYCKTASVNNAIDVHMRRQAEVMRRLGFDEDVIARETEAFRAAVWRERNAFIIRYRQQQQDQHDQHDQDQQGA
jgi:hypothetical protein